MIVYKKLTESELDTFIEMRIAQLTEEYLVSGKTPPEGVDLNIMGISWHTTYEVDKFVQKQADYVYQMSSCFFMLF